MRGLRTVLSWMLLLYWDLNKTIDIRQAGVTSNADLSGLKTASRCLGKVFDILLYSTDFLLPSCCSYMSTILYKQDFTAGCIISQAFVVQLSE